MCNLLYTHSLVKCFSFMVLRAAWHVSQTHSPETALAVRSQVLKEIPGFSSHHILGKTLQYVG